MVKHFNKAQRAEGKNDMAEEQVKTSVEAPKPAEATPVVQEAPKAPVEAPKPAVSTEAKAPEQPKAEIKAELAPEVTPAPVKEEPKPEKVVVKPTQAPKAAGKKDLTAMVAEAKNGSSMLRMVAQNMEKYVDEMTPGKVLAPDMLNRYQSMLWSTIKRVVETDTDFKACFDLIIEFFRNYTMVDGKRHVFHADYLFRGSEYSTMSHIQNKHFFGMLNTLSIASESKNKRQVTSMVDLNRVLSHQVFSDAGRNRVINYFQG